jgi:hypothetical protein
VSYANGETPVLGDYVKNDLKQSCTVTRLRMASSGDDFVSIRWDDGGVDSPLTPAKKPSTRGCSMLICFQPSSIAFKNPYDFTSWVLGRNIRLMSQCGVAAGMRCQLYSGAPRAPHVNRKLSALGITGRQLTVISQRSRRGLRRELDLCSDRRSSHSFIIQR